MNDLIIKTERLVLRPWREADFTAFARLNADPRVMEFFPKALTEEESYQFFKRISTAIERQGWGLWAASLTDKSEAMGFIGLAPIDFESHFTPAVEIGWRLAYDYWNRGYATEGAKAALKYGFDTLKLDEIVAITALQNSRSRNVMEKIGMRHDPQDDFDHPKLPLGHPLSRHVLYRKN